jgi:hypothetical protein
LDAERKLKRSFQVRLLCEKKSESWEVLFSTLKRWISTGWKAFAISNGLQEGDKCVFKLLDELHYIFEVHVIKHGLHDRLWKWTKEKKCNMDMKDEDICGKPKSFHG